LSRATGSGGHRGGLIVEQGEKAPGAPGLMSRTSAVPASLPSLRQSSSPFLAELR
jgi:hypothetical protein